MHIKSLVMLELMDGKERSFGDVLTRISPKLDPRMAVKSYLRRNRRKPVTDVPLEHQLEKGNRRRLMETIFAMREDEEITCSAGSGEVWEDGSILRLTNKGLKHLGNLIFSQTRNEVKAAVKKMWEEEKLGWELYHGD